LMNLQNNKKYISTKERKSNVMNLQNNIKNTFLPWNGNQM